MCGTANEYIKADDRLLAQNIIQNQRNKNSTAVQHTEYNKEHK